MTRLKKQTKLLWRAWGPLTDWGRHGEAFCPTSLDRRPLDKGKLSCFFPPLTLPDGTFYCDDINIARISKLVTIDLLKT